MSANIPRSDPGIADKMVRPTLPLLRALAGEGDFNLYRLLAAGRGGFVFLKCLRTTLAYAWRNGQKPDSATVIWIKGQNQLRLYRNQKNMLEAEFGQSSVYTAPRLNAALDQLHLPRFAIGESAAQAFYLLMMLVTRRRRYLDLFLLAFYAAIRESIDAGLPGVRNFVCYNDQPFDIAAIILALHQTKDCRTVVIQHGLILSEKFYFPANAREFWAWGELSRRHFRSRSPDGKLVIKGRYQDDAESKSDTFVLPDAEGARWKMLVAPSHKHDEIKELARMAKQEIVQKSEKNIRIFMKFHPATKNIWLIKLWIFLFARGIETERREMEILSRQYDILLTKNSTSAVDFLLRGKPVIFSDMMENNDFPSKGYGLEMSDLRHIHNNFHRNIKNINEQRLNFLKNAIYV